MFNLYNGIKCIILCTYSPQLSLLARTLQLYRHNCNNYGCCVFREKGHRAAGSTNHDRAFFVILFPCYRFTGWSQGTHKCLMLFYFIQAC